MYVDDVSQLGRKGCAFDKQEVSIRTVIGYEERHGFKLQVVKDTKSLKLYSWFIGTPSQLLKV